MPEILDPQTRELYEALMLAGHFEDALELADATESKLMNNQPFDYLDHKTATIKNLLIHTIAEALEQKTCSKDPQPCNLCLTQARKIFPSVWEPLEAFINKLKSFTTITQWQMLSYLGDALETKPVTPKVPDVVGPKILKAPKRLEGDAHGDEWY